MNGHGADLLLPSGQARIGKIQRAGPAAEVRSLKVMESHRIV